MSLLYLVTAHLQRKPASQHAGAALLAVKGLQQLCTWAADPLEGPKRHSQTTTPAVEAPSQRNSEQIFGNSAATSPAVKCGIMPDWPGSQQVGQAVLM